MNKWKIGFLLIGITSITSQIILLREFFVVFVGNELSLGIVLSNWLLLTATGSLVSNKFIEHFKQPETLFILSFIVPVILLPVDIIIIRDLLNLTGISYGEYFPLLKIWFSSLLILIPNCIAIGMQFNYACEIFKEQTNDFNTVGSKICMYESSGSLLGSVVLTFLLLNWLHPIRISIILLCLCFCFLYFLKKKFIYFIVLAGLLVFLISPLSISAGNYIDKFRWNNINNNYTLLESVESNYGNLAIIEYEQEKLLFSNTSNTGNLSDRSLIKNFVHIAANESPDFKSILLVGGSVNGFIEELLKYKPDKIDAIEIDPKIINLSRKYLPDKEKQKLSNTKVNLIIDDARHYISKTNNKYDLIICNVPEPFNANFNRFYTREFYDTVSKKLNPNGVYTFNLTSSENYLGPELGQLNASIYQTLKKSFKNIVIIPGSKAIFLASKSNILTTDPKVLSMRYKSQNISSKYFFPEIFSQLLHSENISFMNNEINKVQNFKINSDINPVSYFLDLYIYNKYTKTSNILFDFLGKLNFLILLSVLIAAFIIFTLFEKVARRSINYYLSMFCIGFVGISLNLILIYSFQSTHGGLYYYVGLLIACFMGGIFLGSFLFNKFESILNTSNFYINLLFILILVFISLLSVFLVHTYYINSISIYFLLNIIAGLLVGFGYTIINTGFIKSNKRNINGTIYALDLFGAALGALIVTGILLPIIGILQTLIFLALIIFLTFTKINYFKEYN